MVESIKELREICQKSKIEKDVFLYTIFYRKISIYITKALLHTSVSANQVTIFSMLVGIAGGIFLIPGKSSYSLIGALILQLFILLDMVDGEIARYRRTSSFNGDYLDYGAHFIVVANLFACLSFSVYNNIHHISVFIFGFSAAIFSILYKSISLLCYHTICVKQLEIVDQEGKSSSRGIVAINNRETGKGNIYRKSTLLNPSIKKIIYFFVGMFCDLYITLILLLAVILDMFLPEIRLFSFSLNYQSLFLFIYGSVYPFIVIGTTAYILMTNQIRKSYDKLFKK